MAIVKGPAFSLLASGNLGGICYARWRGLQIARNVWTGSVPNTAKQVVIQGHLASVAGSWGSGLVQAERDAWNAYALQLTRIDRLGQPYHPSGYNTFVAYSLMRLWWGYAVLLMPPAEHRQRVPTFMSVSSSGASSLNVNLHYTTGATNVDGSEYWVAGPFNTQAYKAREHQYRYRKRKFFPSGSGQSWSQTPINKWYWLKARYLWFPGYVGNFWYKQHFHSP